MIASEGHCFSIQLLISVSCLKTKLNKQNNYYPYNGNVLRVKVKVKVKVQVQGRVWFWIWVRIRVQVKVRIGLNLGLGFRLEL